MEFKGREIQNLLFFNNDIGNDNETGHLYSRVPNRRDDGNKRDNGIFGKTWKRDDGKTYPRRWYILKN